MVNQVKKEALRAVLVAALGAGAWLHAGEKVELKGSTSVELPKPTRVFEEPRRFKFDSNAGELDGGFAPAVSANNNGAPIDRKLREMLDRKRNWIFVNPYENQYDARTSEVLENDKVSNLLEHRLLKDDDKGAMEKFLEEKSSRRSDKDPSSPNSSPETRDRETSERTRSAFTEANAESKRDEKTSAVSFGPRNNNTTIFKPMESGMEVTDFQKRMERSPLDGSVFNQSRPAEDVKFEKEELKRLEEAHDADFNKLIQPRGLSGGLPGATVRLDSLNTSVDGSRQEVNPIGPRRSDPFLSAGRTDFSGASRGGGLSATLPSANSIDFGNLNSRVSKEPSFMPTPLPGPSAQGPYFGQSPFVLEFPRRKF